MRKSAMFCPQCGNPVVTQTTTTANVSQSAPTQVLSPQPDPPAHTGVAETVRERVEKIKHVSSVVIDQAAYDPSLRFLLVAVALFVLFLVLMFLSKVLG